LSLIKYLFPIELRDGFYEEHTNFQVSKFTQKRMKYEFENVIVALSQLKCS